MLRKEGLTQAQIGDRIGWSREQVRNYIFVLDKVGTEVLDLARKHQNGRVPKNGTIVPFDFTEGWFRNSGLYDLCEKYQLALMEAFITDKCKWNNEKVQKEAAKFKRWQEYAKLAEETLMNADDLSTIITMIENDAFKTEAQLRQKIND